MIATMVQIIVSVTQFDIVQCSDDDDCLVIVLNLILVDIFLAEKHL